MGDATFGPRMLYKACLLAASLSRQIVVATTGLLESVIIQFSGLLLVSPGLKLYRSARHISMQCEHMHNKVTYLSA